MSGQVNSILFYELLIARAVSFPGCIGLLPEMAFYLNFTSDFCKELRLRYAYRFYTVQPLF